MIKIDSRRCGAGKSTQIRQRALVDNTIIVVPSVHLIKEYQSELPDSRAVFSDGGNNVQSDLHDAFLADSKIIIITHKAFQESQILTGTRGRYNLVIDEAFDPWRMQTYQQENTDINYDWRDVISITPDPDVDEWNHIKLIYDIRTNDISKSSNFVRDLYSPNWCNIIKTEQYDNWCESGSRRIEFVQELNPELMRGWRSVWVAAARFEMTFMYWWFRKHQLKFDIELPFEPHDTQVNIHYPDNGDGGTTWSKYRMQQQPEIKQAFHKYIKQITGNKIRLKNNYDTSLMSNTQAVSHNAAGINSMGDICHVIMESSLNPTPIMGEWLKSQAYNYLPTDIKPDQAVYEARTGYVFYQVAMRCCLRNQKPADLYVIDNRAVVSLAGYFRQVDMTDIHYTTQTKPPALTPTEKSKAARAKKRSPEKYQGLDTRQILALLSKE